MPVDGGIAVAVGAGVTNGTTVDTDTVGAAGAPVSLADRVGCTVGGIDDPPQATRASNSIAANNFMAE